MKMASKLSPKEVADFYGCNIVADITICDGDAQPFGKFTVEIIKPLTRAPSKSDMVKINDYSNHLAYLRDINDPVGETIVLIEVTWAVNPWPIPIN